MPDFFTNLVGQFGDALESGAEAVSNAVSDIADEAFDKARALGSKLDGENVWEDDQPLTGDEKNRLDKYIFSSATSLEYPLKVGEEDSRAPEQLHSVRFSILARENSRVAQETTGLGQDLEREWAGPVAPSTTLAESAPVDDTDRNRLSADQRRAVALLSSGVAGAALGLSVVGSKGNLPGKAVSGLLGGTLAAGGGAAVIESVRTVRTLGQINLFISQPPISKYSANWENKELGALAGLSDTEFNISDLLKGAGGVGELGIRGAIKAAANLPSQFGLTGELGAAVDLASAKVANPYKEQLFTSMGFRQFAFNYKFAPKNLPEYENVKRIIDLFKYHMHPENDPTGLFLEYPSEFEIEYCYKGNRNKHLNKISACALTDIKITYGNQDAFTTFMGTDGAPVEINLELAFTELETLTNNRIADGF